MRREDAKGTGKNSHSLNGTGWWRFHRLLCVWLWNKCLIINKNSATHKHRRYHVFAIGYFLIDSELNKHACSFIIWFCCCT